MIDSNYTILDHSDDNEKNTFAVSWSITDICNYRCSYCVPSLHMGKIGYPNYESVLSFSKMLIERCKRKKIYFIFTGGEVTTWKFLPSLIKELKQYDKVFISIVSNGSKPLDYWNTIKDYIDNISLSFHSEFSNVDKFIDIIKLLHNIVRVHINIMMNPNKFDICVSLAETIIKKEFSDISLTLQPLTIDFGDKIYPYTDDQFSIINNQDKLFTSKIKWTKKWDKYRGKMKMIYSDSREIITSDYNLIINQGNKWRGWKCYAGIEQIIIDFNGEVWRGWCKEGNKLGTIYTGIDNNIKPIICTKEFCRCGFDIKCKKERLDI
jgi:MoaA/NifB/PqqE/SkfB family radical SAM enzyme